MRVAAVMTVLLISVVGPTRADVPAALPAVTLSAGLEARVGLVGRSQERDRVSVTMQIENKGKKAVQLLLIGPAPFAADNAGITYDFVNVSGAAQCSTLHPADAASCIGHPKGEGDAAPLRQYTQIDPGAQASMTFGLSGRPSEATMLGFSATFAYRLVRDPLNEQMLSEDERRAQLRTISVSLPAFPISQVKQ